jgi:hypothetical protein
MTDILASLQRDLEGLSDDFTVMVDELSQLFGGPGMLTDEEKDAIEQRAFGRTLQEIDELVERSLD